MSTPTARRDGGPASGRRPTSRRRGTLRVYLGAAPGVGKTYDMLNEGRRRRDRGTDVVVGYVETHGRAQTAAQIADLEVVPRAQLTYRDASFEEMDLDAVLARAPEVVLVDELAHTNVPGSRHEKRWQDAEVLRDAGIDVISTVNIQHVESVNDVVERITGIRQQETIPDDVVRDADQVELVDMTAQALRRRLVHGNVYAPEKIDAALANYFREGNLTALRELALLWLADKVDVALERYRAEHGITTPWETKERVVVALTGALGTEALIRRAARIAQRARGELLGVHVHSDEGLTGPSITLLDRHRKLLEDMGGEYHEVTGNDVGAALIDFANAENATQVVLGASQRSRWEELLRGSVIKKVVRLSGPIDVLVISHEPGGASAGSTRWSRWRRQLVPIPPRRRLTSWALALGGVPLLTLLFSQLRDEVGLPTVLLGFLALTVATAAVGGTGPAVVSALAGFLAGNWFFTLPHYRWIIHDHEDVVALLVFVGVALIVSSFVNAATRRALEAARARSEASTLARLAATAGGPDPLPELLESLRSALGQDCVALLHRRSDGTWEPEASAGQPIPSSPGEADTVEMLGSEAAVVLSGESIAAQDQLIFKAFAAQLAVVIEQRRLRTEADRAHALAEADALRSALLQAVSHDLRTPLAAIKVSASSLAQNDVHWSDDETADFLRTINEETDRLTSLVANLLDMSRIQAEALKPSLQPVALEEVVPAAIVSLGASTDRADADLPETLPHVMADTALLERALANVIDNAIRFSPDDQPVQIKAVALGDRLELQIIDHGPGIPRQDRERIFGPFQRLGDGGGPGGIGLGLAVTLGFLTAMDATIEAEDTPGGGTTMHITLPTAQDLSG